MVHWLSGGVGNCVVGVSELVVHWVSGLLIDRGSHSVVHWVSGSVVQWLGGKLCGLRKSISGSLGQWFSVSLTEGAY